MDEPKPGERYRHFKGGLYRIVCCCTEEMNGQRLVIYSSSMDSRIWARPLANFQQTVTWEQKDDEGKERVYTALRFEQIGGV
jgi:hypothetical protein